MMRADVPRNKRQTNARARTVLCWGLLAFIEMLSGFSVVAEFVGDRYRDPEYEAKLAKLRARLAAEPHRPLILILGSSRSGVGIRPGECQSSVSADTSPTVFNFALNGAGPRQQLIVLHRLLAEGIRPAGVLSEVLPAILYQEGCHGEDAAIKSRRMEDDELAISGQPVPPPPNPLEMSWPDWLEFWFSRRIRVLCYWAPSWVEGEPMDQGRWRKLDDWGWLPFSRRTGPPTAEECRRGIAWSRREYEARLIHWTVSDVADRAVRELLQTCQHEEISAALFLMPEGTPFREFYPPRVRAGLESYLARVCQDHEVTLFDATLWGADDDFRDGHHLLIDGATRFSQRFGRELIAPFVAKHNRSRVLSQRPTDERR